MVVDIDGDGDVNLAVVAVLRGVSFRERKRVFRRLDVDAGSDVRLAPPHSAPEGVNVQVARTHWRLRK